MITKITGEQPFQVLTNNFSISPSQEGYTLQISADGRQYSNLFSVGAGVTRLVTGVAANSYYRLLGNQSRVSVNWMKTCVTEGSGGGAAGNELIPQDTLPQTADAGTVVALTDGGIYQYDGTEWVPMGGDIDLSGFWNSAQTKTYVDSADAIIYASAVTYTDNAVSGLATEEYVDNQISDIEEMIPDGTILKAVEEFPEDPEMGDVVSKLMPADIASWNTSDDTTAKMHIDTDILNALDTGETYTIAEFPSVDGTIELVAKVQPSRSNVPAWCLYEYVGGEEGSIICQLTSTDEESAVYQIPNNMRAPVTYYTSVNYLEDDFSEKEGMMIQIGRITDPSDPTMWTGSYSEISGLELYPIGGGHVVDGTYIYDGTEWKNTKEKTPTAQILKSIGCDNEDWTDNIIYESGLTDGDIFSIRVKDGDKEDWLNRWAECDVCGGEWMSFENHDENRRYYTITQTFHREDQENPWRNFSIWFDDTNVFSGGNTYHMYYDYDNKVIALDKVRENQDDPGPELYLGGEYYNRVYYDADGVEHLVLSVGNDDSDAECGENTIHIFNINCRMDASNDGPWYFTKADSLTYVEYDDWKYPYYPVPYIVNGGEADRIVTSNYLDETMQNYTPTTGFSTINGSAITQGGNIKIEGGSTPDMSAYYTSAQTEDAISAALTPYYTSAQTTAILEEAGIIEYDSSTSSTTINSLTELYMKVETDERVNSVALNELHDDLNTISAATAGKADATALTAYTPTTGFSTINGSAITGGGNIEIQGGGADMSAYWTSAETQEAIDEAISGFTPSTNSPIIPAITTQAEYEAISGDVKTGDLIQVEGVDINGDGNPESGLFGAFIEEEEDGGVIRKLLTWGRKDNGDSVLWSNNDYPWMDAEGVRPIDLGNNAFIISPDFAAAEYEAYIGIGFDADGKPVITHIAPQYDEETGEVTGITREDTPIGGGADMSAFYTSAQTEYAITSKNYVTSAQVETQIVSKNYITSAETANFVTSAQVETQIEAKNYVNSGDVKSQVEAYNYATVSQIPTVPTSNTAFTNDAGYITSAATQNMVTSTTITTMWKGTQAEYDAATQSGATADPNTFYIILPSA